MRRALLYLSSTLVSLASVVSLESRPSQALQRQGFGGRFEVGAEALYLRLSGADFTYSIEEKRPFDPGQAKIALPFGDQRRLPQSYQWGVRVVGRYLFSCRPGDLTCQYTSLRSNGRREEGALGEGGFLPTFGQPRFEFAALYNGLPNPYIVGVQVPKSLRVQDRSDYRALEFQFGTHCEELPCLFLRRFVAIEVVHFHQRLEASYSGTMFPGVLDLCQTLRTEIAERYHTALAGPKLGVEARVDVACGFGLGAKLAAGLLAGGVHGRQDQGGLAILLGSAEVPLRIEPIDLHVKFPSERIVSAVINCRLGVNYHWYCSCCFAAFVEAGYEIAYYNNIRRRINLTNISALQSKSRCGLGLDGFYISGRIAF